MIIKRTWKSGELIPKYSYDGWFLLGIIPLYISRTKITYRLYV